MALFIATCLGSPVCVVAGLKLGMFATPRARCLQNMSKLTLQRVSPILKILPFNTKLEIAIYFGAFQTKLMQQKQSTQRN